MSVFIEEETLCDNNNVFALEIPCDDIFYGFQTKHIYSSVNNAINTIKSCKIKPRKFKYDTISNKIVFQFSNNTKQRQIEENNNIIKNNNYILCYEVAAFNIKEYKINDEEIRYDLIDDIYLRIDFDYEKNICFIFKDNDMYNCHEKVYYTYEILNEKIYNIKFINYNK